MGQHMTFCVTTHLLNRHLAEIDADEALIEAYEDQARADLLDAALEDDDQLLEAIGQISDRNPLARVLSHAMDNAVTDGQFDSICEFVARLNWKHPASHGHRIATFISVMRDELLSDQDAIDERAREIGQSEAEGDRDGLGDYLYEQERAA